MVLSVQLFLLSGAFLCDWNPNSEFWAQVTTQQITNGILNEIWNSFSLVSADGLRIEGRENGNIILRLCWYHRKLRVLIVRNGRVIYGYLSLTSIDVTRTIFITLLPTFLINPPFCSPEYRTFTRNICPSWSKNPHTLPTQTQCTCYMLHIFCPRLVTEFYHYSYQNIHWMLKKTFELYSTILDS